MAIKETAATGAAGYDKAGTLPRRKLDWEIHALRAGLAGAGGLIVVGALAQNAGSVLLALAACLACAGRMERLYQRGAYGRVKAEVID